ncbi:hypothetical protein ACWD7F_19300 [Streptomyces sp. NPDC005122]
MLARINVASLTQLQLDGVTCVVCGQLGDLPMIPVGPAPSGLVDLHAHVKCADPATAPAVLVVGNTAGAVALADVVAFAYDVAERLGLSVRVATGMDEDVTQYEGVVLEDTWLDSVASTVLGTESKEADLFCVSAAELYAFPADNSCHWCGEGGRVAPRRTRDGWTAPMHFTCASQIRKASVAVAVGV